METDGVLETYQQSKQKHNVWYNSFIGDEDISAYARVSKNRPYDSVVFIQKECAIHVTKRIDSNLRRLTGKKLTNI